MATPHNPQEGEVWIVNFSPQRGREQAGVRPALVISSSWFNDTVNHLHIVCPITTTNRGLAYHLMVEPPEGGLTRPSLIMCDQEKSQSIERFLSRRGKVSEETLRAVQRMVGRIINAHLLFEGQQGPSST